jgi:hypothetical protein
MVNEKFLEPATRPTLSFAQGYTVAGVIVKTSYRLAAAILIAALGSAACAASASATQFQFSYSIPTVDTKDFPSGFTSASGILTATPDGPGTYLVTHINGLWNGDAILGLASLGGNDNLIFPTSTPVLDINGLAFQVAGSGDGGSGKVNVYYCVECTGPGTASGYTDLDDATGLSATFNLSQIGSVPEPLTLSVVGAGLLSAAAMRRRKAKQ